MIDSFDLDGFRLCHARCECETEVVWIDYLTARLKKGGLEIEVEGLEIALDCDLCEAFTEEDLRPDVISIRPMQYGVPVANN